jgi:hypothetical protein
MPPTVRTPWFAVGCVLGVELVGVGVGEPLPPEPGLAPEVAGALEPAFPPELVLPPALVFPPELALLPALVFPPEALAATGVAPLLATWVPDVPLLLGGVAVPDVAALLGVPVLEPLPAGAAVYASPATPAVAGCAVVVAPLLCAKSYAIAPPRARVAMTFSVMNTIATRSLMGSFSFWAW